MKILREVKRKEHLEAKLAKSHKDDKFSVIIGVKNGYQPAVAESLGKLGNVDHVYDLIPYISVTMSAGDVQRITSKMHSKTLSDELSSITTINVVSKVSKVPSFKHQPDVYHSLEFSSLWNLRNIGVYGAHKISTGSNISIGIIDTGIDYNHPELRSNFGKSKGVDLVNLDSNPMDEEGHGTHVAGTSCSNNYGVSLDSTLYAVRVLNEYGSGSEADVIAGVEWCIKNEIDVMNMSLGSRDASRAFEDICRLAYNNGHFVVAAAGNERYGPSYPASFDESVIAVAAVNQANQHADFSNICETNDISAPGVDIMSCYPGGGSAILSGTSMATPHITGTIALALSVYNDMDLEQIMEDTADHLDSERDYDNQWIFGSGLVRADHLLEQLTKSSVFQKTLHNKYQKQL